MARLFTSGFEFNSVTAGHEFSSISGSATIASTGARTGTYRGQINSAVASTQKSYNYQFASANNLGSYFLRCYFKVDTLPNNDTAIMAPADSTGNSPCGINLTTGGTLIITDNAGANVGSPSSALTLGQWYRLELNVNTTAGNIEGKIDGTTFASMIGGADLGATGVRDAWFGVNLGGFNIATTLDISYDDLAINDSSGAAQNSWPGAGKVIRLKPNAAGDVNTFATQTGGTAGAANNFTRVNEVTPDDATTLNGSSTLNQEDLFNMEDSGIGASDTVTLVQVWGRFRNSTADATAKITFELEKAAAGTKTSSSAITPNSTTFQTNVASTTQPKTAVITAYTDPGGSAWTQSTVDAMQVGYKLTTGPGTAGRRIDVTSLSAIVEYVPAATSVTATPGVVALTLTTFAPVIQLRINGASPTALVLATFAPNIVLGTTFTPPIIALSLTTFAPTVLTPRVVTPPIAALTLATFVPQVNLGIIPPTAALVITTFAPVPAVSNNQVATPGVLALALTTYAPTLQFAVIPSTTALVLTTFAPTINISQTLTPAPVALVLTPYAPVVTATLQMLVTPPIAALILSTFAPSVGAWRDVPLGIIVTSPVEDRTLANISDDRVISAAVANRSLEGGIASNSLAGASASATISTSTNDRTVG